MFPRKVSGDFEQQCQTFINRVIQFSLQQRGPRQCGLVLMESQRPMELPKTRAEGRLARHPHPGNLSLTQNHWAFSHFVKSTVWWYQQAEFLDLVLVILKKMSPLQNLDSGGDMRADHGRTENPAGYCSAQHSPYTTRTTYSVTLGCFQAWILFTLSTLWLISGWYVGSKKYYIFLKPYEKKL